VEKDEGQVLIAGAGAVGQVYGLHLRRGGARVTFLVKPAHAAWCQQGFALHRLGKQGRRETRRLDDVEILTNAADAAGLRWDQIWLGVASDALRGAWLGTLLAGLGNATLVALQPDLDDRALLLRYVPESQLVQGLIGFLSYQSPLPGDREPPGVAYALLPPAASHFSGPPERVRPILETLARGGFPARALRALPARSAARSAASVPVVAALELADWSLPRLLRGPTLGLGLRAAREAQAVVAAHLGRGVPLLARLLYPLPVRLALRLAPRLTAFDLEAYLRFHFTKVGPQTRLMLGTWCTRAEAAGGIPTPALCELRDRLRERDERPRSHSR
jgi:2-dehydropantoate 2-reductase